MFSRGMPLAVTILMLAMVGAVAVALPAAAAELPTSAPPSFTVTGDPSLPIGGLTPGESMPPTVLTISATGAISYRLHAETAGSTALAQALEVRIVTASTGAVLYEGALGAASFGGPNDVSGARTLRDASETLAITTSLPNSAGNDVQGATLAVRWIFDAIGVERT